MRLLNPSWLWLGLLALPILVMYMLKLRRREVPVSSTLLWEMLLRDRQANAPWQRLRRNLLLFLQLLILAALVLGLARPALPAPGVAAGSLVVLLDASASMNASDVQPSRFEAARSAARSLVDGLESGSRMTLILAGRQPQVLASAETDRPALRRALDAIPAGAAPTQGAVNWQAAFALAAGAVPSQNAADGEKTTIVIISDGGLPAQDLPPLPGEVRYIPVGKTGENLAISALALRPGANGPELFAQAANYGQDAHPVLLSVYSDDQLLTSRQFIITPGEHQSLTLTGLNPGATIYKAQLSSLDGKSLDAFPLDDTAFAVYTPASGGHALLLSKGNLFLEQLLAAMPGLTPFRAMPDETGQIQLPEESFNLYVLDGLFPEKLLGANSAPGNLLVINPPPNPLFEATGIFSDTGLVQVSEHPLAQYVDWGEVHVRKARLVQPPAWADVLVRAQGGPLVFAGETGGRRVAVVTFDLHDSDLPLQVTFPILFSNLVNYLAPARAFEAPEGLQPGESLRIGRPPAAGSSPPERIAIASPSGKVYTLTPEENGVTFNKTDELGVYAVNYLSVRAGEGESKGGSQGAGQGAPPADYFAVNLFDEGESRILPAPAIQVGRSAISPAGQSQLGQRELWPWVAALGLVVLLVEWMVYHRRIHFRTAG